MAYCIAISDSISYVELVKFLCLILLQNSATLSLVEMTRWQGLSLIVSELHYYNSKRASLTL